MIRVYTTSQGRITQYKNISFDEIQKINNIIWIDLQSPSAEEKEFVEKNYKIEFFTSLELQEIESSSRFIETEETIDSRGHRGVAAEPSKHHGRVRRR